MIKVYGNGEDFWNENGEMLLREPEKTGFFRGNAALLKKTDLNNYALRCEEDGHIPAGRAAAGGGGSDTARGDGELQRVRVEEARRGGNKAV